VIAVAVLATRAAAQCTLDPETGCKVTCDGASYNLAVFQKGSDASGTDPGAGYYAVTDSGGEHKFYFNGCGAVADLTCKDSKTQNTVAIQTWGTPFPTNPFPSDNCAGLGSLSQASCSKNGTDSVRCDYSGGDSGRDVTFVYACAKTMGDSPTASQDGDMSYIISFSGPAACGTGGGGGGLSWGSLTLILGPIFIGLYIAAGYYYNYKYKELRGVEAVPQIEYWRELPGLVKDGCIFSYQQTRRFIKYLQDKHAGAPADPALKQALANDEDGAASTSYEENKA